MDGLLTKQPRLGKVRCPEPGSGLERRAHHLRIERRAQVAPQAMNVRVVPAQPRVVAPDNRIVESDEWIGGIVEGPVVTNWVLDTLHQLGRHESFNDRSHGSTRNLDVSGKLAGGMVP